MADPTYDADQTPTAPRTIDEQLFGAWQANDRAACEEIWSLFNMRVYTVAVTFCRRFVDPSTARQIATSAFSKAWLELEWENDDDDQQDEEGTAPSTKAKKSTRRTRTRAKRAGKLAIAWQGAPQLEKYVRNLVLHRCRDELRVDWRWIGRLDDRPGAGAEEQLTAFADLASSPATQEDDLLREDRNRAGVRRIVLELASLVESCRCADGDSERAALLDVLVEMRAYLRDRFIAAGPLDAAVLADGQDWTALTLEELAEAVDPHNVQATKSAMYARIMERLSLPSKNTLYTRIADIRAMRRGPLMISG